MFFDDASTHFHILSVVEFTHSSPDWRPVAVRDFHVLSFRLRGSAGYRGDIYGNVLENSVMYIPANLNYEIRCAEESLIVFHFEMDGPFSPPEWYHPRNAVIFRDAFRSAVNTWQNQKPGYYQKTMSLFYGVLSELSRQFDPTYNSASYLRIKDALDYLYLHFTEPDLTVSKLCNICHMSDTQFRKLFFDVYETTPLDHINRLRTDRASELLATSFLGVEEIARLSGFSDSKYFSYVFKKYRNCTPSSYRKNA